MDRAKMSAALVMGTITMVAVVHAEAQEGSGLCVPGAGVEIMVGGEWWEGTVRGPNEDGSCVVANTTYAGHEMVFHVAPDRMRPAGASTAAELGMKPSDPRCVPGASVEVRIGGEWHEGTVVAPHRTDGSCAVRNTSYAGYEMVIAAASDTFRLPGTRDGDDTAAGQSAGARGKATGQGVAAPQPAQEQGATAPQPAQDNAGPPATPPAEGPPEGRYHCQQFIVGSGWAPMTSLTVKPGGRYEVGGAEGEYRYDASTGEVEWLSGSYREWGWTARLELLRGRPVFRITDADEIFRITCYPTGS